MNTTIIPAEDIAVFEQQPASAINSMVTGMLTLLSENAEKATFIENQSWFKRMANTILGKNKATIREMRQNHDKLNAYVVQAVTELYNRDKISSQIMVSLSLQITELYNSHLELKGMLHSLASKLNEKIESVDNYHTLLQGIDVGLFGRVTNIVQLFKILSHIDSRVVNESSKMEIVRLRLAQRGLLDSSKKINALQFVLQVMDCDTESAGMIHMDLGLYTHPFARLAVAALENYALEPESQKKYLNKNALAKKVIEDSSIIANNKYAIADVFDELMELRQEIFLAMPKITGKLNITEQPKSAYHEDSDVTMSDEDNDEDDTPLTLVDAVPALVDEFFCGDASCNIHVGFLSYGTKDAVMKNIINKKSLFGRLLGTKDVGNFMNGTYTCNHEDIIAIIDTSTFSKYKEGIVFTRHGVVFSRAIESSAFISYGDIMCASGTPQKLMGKLSVGLDRKADFVWSDTILPKDKVADLLCAIKEIEATDINYSMDEVDRSSKFVDEAFAEFDKTMAEVKESGIIDYLRAMKK